MTWGDEGYILGVNTYGENSSIISILSKEHGHHKGIIYGGTSSKLKKLIHMAIKLKLHGSQNQKMQLVIIILN